MSSLTTASIFDNLPLNQLEQHLATFLTPLTRQLAVARLVLAWFNDNSDEFMIRARHLERKVAVYNLREQRWEENTVGELAENVLWQRQCLAALYQNRIRLGSCHDLVILRDTKNL